MSFENFLLIQEMIRSLAKTVVVRIIIKKTIQQLTKDKKAPAKVSLLFILFENFPKIVFFSLLVLNILMS